MSADTSGAAGSGPGGPEPSEEELRAAYEAELARITVTDVIAQTAVSLLNLAAQRLAPRPDAPEAAVDLEQVRDAIDGVRALLGILERRIPQEVRPLRDALSQLQLAYAAAAKAAGGEPEAEGAPAQAAAPAAASPTGAPAAEPGAAEEPGEKGEGPGPAESSGRLWVPGR